MAVGTCVRVCAQCLLGKQYAEKRKKCYHHHHPPCIVLGRNAKRIGKHRAHKQTTRKRIMVHLALGESFSVDVRPMEHTASLPFIGSSNIHDVRNGRQHNDNNSSVSSPNSFQHEFMR